MNNYNERIVELAEEARIDKPFQLSSFLYLRAVGEDNVDIAELLGVNRKTLTRWDNRISGLEDLEHAELVVKSVVTEYQERIGGL